MLQLNFAIKKNLVVLSSFFKTYFIFDTKETHTGLEWHECE